jgi:16S rRNA (uracil1498-N3)-methyltransferase
LRKMAISAMKQSLKARLPKINPPTPFSQVVTNGKAAAKFIAFVDPTNPTHLKDAAKKNESALVLIGPEGDFSANELQLALSLGYKKVTLGNSRLRTETAGLAACHILNLVNE